MSTSSINFNNKNIKKATFTTKPKKIFSIDDIDVNKILVSKKEQYGKYSSSKHFVGYNNGVIRHYINLFQKRLAISINLVKIK